MCGSENWHEMILTREYSLQGSVVRVVKPNLLFCIHQWDSEGVCRGEGESRRLSRLKRVIG